MLKLALGWLVFLVVVLVLPLVQVGLRPVHAQNEWTGGRNWTGEVHYSSKSQGDYTWVHTEDGTLSFQIASDWTIKGTATVQMYASIQGINNNCYGSVNTVLNYEISGGHAPGDQIGIIFYSPIQQTGVPYQVTGGAGCFVETEVAYPRLSTFTVNPVDGGSQTCTDCNGGSQTITIHGQGSAPPAAAPFDFGISVSPSTLSVNQGDSATYTVYVNLLSGTAQLVTLQSQIHDASAEFLNSVSAQFGTESGVPPFTTTLTIQTSGSTPLGTYTKVVHGDGGGVAHDATMTMVVVQTIHNTYVPPATQNSSEVYVPPSKKNYYSPPGPGYTGYLLPILGAGVLGAAGYGAYRYSKSRNGGTGGKIDLDKPVNLLRAPDPGGPILERTPQAPADANPYKGMKSLYGAYIDSQNDFAKTLHEVIDWLPMAHAVRNGVEVTEGRDVYTGEQLSNSEMWKRGLETTAEAGLAIGGISETLAKEVVEMIQPWGGPVIIPERAIAAAEAAAQHASSLIPPPNVALKWVEEKGIEHGIEELFKAPFKMTDAYFGGGG